MHGFICPTCFTELVSEEELAEHFATRHGGDDGDNDVEADAESTTVSLAAQASPQRSADGGGSLAGRSAGSEPSRPGGSGGGGVGSFFTGVRSQSGAAGPIVNWPTQGLGVHRRRVDEFKEKRAEKQKTRGLDSMSDVEWKVLVLEKLLYGEKQCGPSKMSRREYEQSVVAWVREPSFPPFLLIQFVYVSHDYSESGLFFQ